MKFNFYMISVVSGVACLKGREREKTKQRKRGFYFFINKERKRRINFILEKKK